MSKKGKIVKDVHPNCGYVLTPRPLLSGERERVPLAFLSRNAKGEVTPSPLERGPGG